MSARGSGRGVGVRLREAPEGRARTVRTTGERRARRRGQDPSGPGRIPRPRRADPGATTGTDVIRSRRVAVPAHDGLLPGGAVARHGLLPGGTLARHGLHPVGVPSRHGMLPGEVRASDGLLPSEVPAPDETPALHSPHPGGAFACGGLHPGGVVAV
ncbi:hypothetical protein ACWEP4_40785 [Streptomyces sp. NPDC004227]